jgi:hypothetical protein
MVMISTIEGTPTGFSLLTQQIELVTKELVSDLPLDEKKHLLTEIRDARRALTTLEYEVMDGIHEGRGDAC